MFNAAHLLLQIPSPLKPITVTFNNQKANLLELNLLTSSMNIQEKKERKFRLDTTMLITTYSNCKGYTLMSMPF